MHRGGFCREAHLIKSCLSREKTRQKEVGKAVLLEKGMAF